MTAAVDTGARLDAEVALACYFCSQAHDPTGQDGAPLQMHRLTFNFPNGGETISPVCVECAAPKTQGNVSITPLSAVDAARLFDADLDQELASVLDTGAAPVIAQDRMLVADRLLRRLAQDEAMINNFKAVQQRETDMIAQRYQALRKPIERRAWWRRQALEELAAAQFPNPKVKPKSLNLPYGTIARRDSTGAPVVADGAVATKSYLADPAHWSLLDASWKSPLSELLAAIVGLLASAETNSHEGSMSRETMAREWILAQAEDMGDFGAPLGLSLRWGALKKAILAKDAPLLAGVTLDEGSTEFTVKVTSAPESER